MMPQPFHSKSWVWFFFHGYGKVKVVEVLIGGDGEVTSRLCGEREVRVRPDQPEIGYRRGKELESEVRYRGEVGKANRLQAQKKQSGVGGSSESRQWNVVGPNVGALTSCKLVRNNPSR